MKNETLLVAGKPERPQADYSPVTKVPAFIG